MENMVDGFVFNDFCLQCQKVMEHKVALEGNEFFAVCSKCDQKRHMINLNQVYYPKTDLWVTRFKVGNLPSVVAGKLLDAVKHAKRTMK
ncbi:hypothetical protein A3K71_06760 [archaeon RBG_16_50_20]|nr:MAG: hypothetical protein A3K71_06760 [archaeon RBG_16_50_20]